ncbi:MAG: dTDP-4-dehydrorhamnose 3,5-epimerase family protein [Candidatus Marinimicrobia bacterium]|nr:dTDP-4-dehydrorhamnose 3,5-epimerase family protein [Candidatus Neomarinimicrobiota bacterium]
MKISKKIQDTLKLQDYSKKPVIDGVKILQLRRFNDDGGSFTELGRLTSGALNDLPEVTIAQINYSEMDPGAIKAFHVHLQQIDIWYVPPSDKVVLILVDIREVSATKDVKMKIVLGDGNSKLVMIPPGVAHGCRNISVKTSRIIYFMDKNFTDDPKKCDEFRLPWDHFGAEIWEVQKG